MGATQAFDSDFDYIIVGAGSAGCVLANRLSADSSLRVLLIEAGGRDNNPWIHIPVGYFKTLHNPETDWCYKTQPDPGLNGRSLDWPRGKTLGGSSSINGLLYIRGQAADYNHWQQLGNLGWGYEDVLPYFKRGQDQERGESEFHGADGELYVSNMRAERKICEAFIDAAVEMGVPRTDDFNGAEQEGAGYFQLTAKNGLRCSTAKAFLSPIKNRKNLTILTKAQVKRLDLDSATKAAKGVILEHKGAEKTVRIKDGGEVVLSAGAIGSPQILELSGVGNPEILKNAGVTPVHALKGVGENLQDHLQLRLVYEVNVPTLNEEINNIFRRIGIGMNFFLRRRGPMSMGASQVCVFAKSMQGLDEPDIQFHFQPLSADKPGLQMHPFRGITSSVCQLRPESRGTIHIHSNDFNKHPLIDANYLSAKEDQDCAVRAVKFARAMTKTKAMSPFVEREHAPTGPLGTDEQLLEAARSIAQTIYHPTSTCKMGGDDMAVVDSRLRVHGIKGLRVADASIMPTIASGNTNAPTIMIGEKASDMILADRRVSI